MNEICGSLDIDGARIAFRRLEGAGPAVVWLGGFRSDMGGTKAQALAEWAQAKGRAFLRFDYFAHGESEGDFAQGTITRWRADALAVIDALTEGPLVLVGSSMGGWIACLVAAVRPERLAGVVLIAPAADMTERLIIPSLPAEVKAQIADTGVWLRPSGYGDAPYPITRVLLEDGARWSILSGPVPITAPVRVLHGREDPDVPWTHGLELFNGLKSADAVFQLIADGDHRLSRPQDIARMIAAVEELT
jgi:pimeloyl-ACP methyl ester carboxylesterase